MKRFIVLVIALAALAGANPIIQTLVSEIVVAPDSLEGIEISTEYWPGGFVDMSGWQVITRAGTATVNPGVIVDGYGVINRENTTGVFGLADDYDEVKLCNGTEPETIRLSYPNSYTDHERAWRPLPGVSAARIAVWVYEPMPSIYYYWYYDETPTMGAANDDTAGGIQGRVTDQQGQPICSAAVHITGPGGGAWFWTNSLGQYRAHPTGPGTFSVSADKSGHSGVFPDSVSVVSGQYRNNIDITIPLVGITELSPVATAQLDWRGRVLRIVVSAPVKADLRTVNVAGQVMRRQTAQLVPGVNEIRPVDGLPTGAYVVRGELGKETIEKRIVVF